ncbi:hypothetical protein D9757_011546 [Collybiopsis confluens]|uniref:3-beta hydroxysteroid dehydrogenase/isomerase domain-containing protein n=1 Tax=Collybiopsis confluens TaxID=2823264 RepID=A0A8H5GBB3_9AGAR|nr:hypothetical protein D9757_011546 [Collybiopsis confluens]
MRRGRTALPTSSLVCNNKNLNDRTYVSNVALALVLAADHLNNDEVAGQTFFITNNDPRPFWDFMRVIWDRFDGAFPDKAQPKKRIVVIPRFFASLLARIMGFTAWILPPVLTPYVVTFATANCHFSSAKAERLLGYKPEIGVDEGIEKTIESYRFGSL